MEVEVYNEIDNMWKTSRNITIFSLYQLWNQYRYAGYSENISIYKLWARKVYLSYLGTILDNAVILGWLIYRISKSHVPYFHKIKKFSPFTGMILYPVPEWVKL